MADDWIMKRKKLINDSRTVGIARALKASRQHVMGCLDLLWSLADDQADTETSALPNFTLEDIDTEVRHKGFAKAVVEVTDGHQDGPWLVLKDGVVFFPDHTKWNGEPAKIRGKDRKRKSGKSSASDPEKRRKKSGKSSVDFPEKSGTEERKGEERGKSPPAPEFNFQDQVIDRFPKPRRINPVAAERAFNDLSSEDRARVVAAVPEYARFFETVEAEDRQYVPGLLAFIKKGVFAEGLETWKTRVNTKRPADRGFSWR